MDGGGAEVWRNAHALTFSLVEYHGGVEFSCTPLMFVEFRHAASRCRLN